MPDAEEAAIKVAAAPPSAPEASCGDSSCTMDHSHGDHTGHSHGHDHGHAHVHAGELVWDQLNTQLLMGLGLHKFPVALVLMGMLAALGMNRWR